MRARVPPIRSTGSMSMRPCACAHFVTVAAVVARLFTTPAPALAAPTPETLRTLAVQSLRHEMTLIPEAGPDRAGTPGFDAALERLMAIDVDGERLLQQLIETGFTASPVVLRTLRRLPPPGSPGRLPRREEYEAAIEELQAWTPPPAEGVVPVPPPPVTPPVTARPSDDAPFAPPAALPPPGDPGGPGAQAPPLTSASTGSSKLLATTAVSGVAGLLVLTGILAARAMAGRRDRTGDLMTIALTDALTGAANRHRFDLDCRALAAGPVVRISILMIDVDLFKQVNDEFGHLAGDEVLRRVARVLLAQARPDAVLLIDYPGFNLRLARALHALAEIGLGKRGVFRCHGFAPSHRNDG